MKAVICLRYGVVELRDVDPPAVPVDGMLVRVRAASINALDWYFMSGRPVAVRLMTGPTKPTRPIPGADFSGTVESVGSAVTRFKAGDEVFGATGGGAFAELVSVGQDRAARKPLGVSFEQAATLPIAGLTALQALRDVGQVQPGQRVLIDGASGGVGHLAVQIAKALGAVVTALCRTRYVEAIRALGADEVLDVERADFRKNGPRHHLMLEITGSKSWGKLTRLLEPGARCVILGGSRRNRWLGPMARMVELRLASLGASQKVSLYVAKIRPEDLAILADFVETKRVSPVIDGRYELADAAAAFRHFAEGHPIGKVVVTA